MKDKQPKTTEVVTSDLRALLFWASVGVSKSQAGSYWGVIEEIIRSYSSYIKFYGLPKAKFQKAKS